MMDEKRMTAPYPSVSTDEGQSLIKPSDSLSEYALNCKYSEAIENEWMKRLPSYIETVSMSELFNNVYRNKPPIIDGLLRQGMYLFVGAPKLGKSFLMAQIAYHVSTGTPLWGFPVRKGTVLYLALEDDYGRLQDRMYRMFGTTENENLFFSITAKPLGNGLDEQMMRFIREHPDTSLIIVDTLQKVRETDGEKYSYASDYQIITRFKTFADDFNLCIMVVHHTRKQKADDSFDMISGTNGLLGAADGAFLLQKDKRTSSVATLEVSGRDQQDQQLCLVRNEETLCWELDHVETELWKLPPEPLLEEIAKRITVDNPEWSGSPTELCSFLGVDMKANALTQKMNVNAGRLMQEYGIQYWNKRTHAGRQVGLRLLPRDDA